MTVIVLTACPEGLRGHLTRWLLEISAGIFIGHITQRVRTLLWTQITQHTGNGRALMIYTTQGEQHIDYQVHEHHWQPVDYDGITLIRRPHPTATHTATGRTGWSTAGRRKRFAQRRTTPTDQNESE